MKDGLFTDQGRGSSKEVVHEDVVILPRMGYDDADAVRLVRPEGKACRR